VQQYDEAEWLHRQTLALRRRVLGNDHGDTITSMFRLADLLMARDRPAEAEPLAREALECALAKSSYGSAHPATRTCARVLADALDALGRPEEARALRTKYPAPTTAPSTAPGSQQVQPRGA
jgi:hypothetical protein